MSGDLLVCPDCRAALAPSGEALRCPGCRAYWPPEMGLPKLFREDRVGPMDRFMRLFYNGLPALHDPLTTHLLPVLQRDGTEAAFREGVMQAIDLASLEPGTDRPVRILEVGIGAGANLPFVQRALPAGLDVEYWGLDLARGMLRQCRRRLPMDRLDVHLVLGDAHALPFPDESFDRVFHVGAIATFHGPDRALAEMARVARRGTPIAVVDEQLDPAMDNSLRDRLAFRLLTFYDLDPHCPSEHVPADAVDVRAEQLSRFLYCLSFRMPAASRA